MAKIIALFLIVWPLFGAEATFDQACVECHEARRVSLQKLYMEYLVRYSSRTRIIEAMTNYLLDPKANLSVLPPWNIEQTGVMEAVTMDEKTLREILEVYVERFAVEKRLK